MSEHSIPLAKVLQKNMQDIEIPKPSWWILWLNIESRYRLSANNPLWATTFADQIVMIAISAVYEALVRERVLFLEPAARSMVQTIPPSWLVKDSSVQKNFKTVKSLVSTLETEQEKTKCLLLSIETAATGLGFSAKPREVLSLDAVLKFPTHQEDVHRTRLRD